jgi:hypothetical protein
VGPTRYCATPHDGGRACCENAAERNDSEQQHVSLVRQERCTEKEHRRDQPPAFAATPGE